MPVTFIETISKSELQSQERLNRIKAGNAQNARIENVNDNDNKTKKELTCLAQTSYFMTKEKAADKYQKFGPLRKFQYYIGIFLDNVIVQVLILLTAGYTLIEKETRILWISVENDKGLEIVLTVSFCILLAEFLLTMISKKNYILSYDCLFDFLSIFSLLTEVKPIWTPIVDAITGFE